MVRFFDGAEVRADGDFIDVLEAELLERLDEDFRGSQRAELSDEGRSDFGVDFLVLLQRQRELEDLRLVGDGAERAVDQTQTAGDALVVVDDRAALLVRSDRVHPAG